jgi:hypothetical protein
VTFQVSLVGRRAWGELVARDQLQLSQATQSVLTGFHEGPLNFAPTFKLVKPTKDKGGPLHVGLEQISGAKSPSVNCWMRVGPIGIRVGDELMPPPRHAQPL